MGAIQKINDASVPAEFPNCPLYKIKKILENKLSERENICSLWNINSFNKLNYAARRKKASWEGVWDGQGTHVGPRPSCPL
jgi:hypothetical protein